MVFVVDLILVVVVVAAVVAAVVGVAIFAVVVFLLAGSRRNTNPTHSWFLIFLRTSAGRKQDCQKAENCGWCVY